MTNSKRVSRLRRIREFGNLTVEDIATRVGQPVSVVKSWEAGTAEPDIVSLRTLALDVYHTSVDDLLGRNPFTPAVVSTGFLYAPGEKECPVSGFWGHVGVLTPGMEKTRWYPIDSDNYRYGYREVQVRGMHQWACIRTLANRVLAINPLAMQRIWFLDDACDGPNGDWEDVLDHNPFEFYRILDLYGRDDPNTYAQEVSSEIKPWVEKWFADWKQEQELPADADPDMLHNWLHDSVIHLVNGKTISYQIAHGDLAQLSSNIETSHEFNEDDGWGVPAMIKLDHDHGNYQCWFPRNQIAMIDMPMLDLWDAVVKENEENDATPNWDEVEEREARNTTPKRSRNQSTKTTT